MGVVVSTVAMFLKVGKDELENRNVSLNLSALIFHKATDV